MKIIRQLLLIISLLGFVNNAFGVAYYHVSTKSNETQFRPKVVKRIFKKTPKKGTEKHGFGGVLAVILGLTGVFIGLKLLKIITWSWFWVLSPIWISVVLIILIIVYVIILFLLMPEPRALEAIPE